MDKSKSPTKYISRSVTRRVGLLSGIGIAGAITSIILSLLVTLNWVDRKFTESKVEAANTFDLFFLTIQSDLLATSQGLVGHDDIDSELLTLRTRNNAFLDVLLVDLNGEILFQRNIFGRPDRINVNVSGWLEAPPVFGKVVIGPVRFEGQTPYVEMVVTVTDSISLPAGILLVQVDLTELWNKTLDIQVGKTGYAYIVDGTGQLVAFRNRRVLETGTKLQDLVGHTPQEIVASTITLYKSINNQSVLAAAQPLKTVGWFAIVEQPISESLTIFLPIGFLLFAVIVSVTVLLRNTIHFTNLCIVSPLLKLRNAVMQMEDGKLDVRVAMPHDDEFGQLGHAFNLMVEEIQTQTESLRESEARYRLIADNTADVIWVIDVENMRFKYVSPSVEKIRGYTPREVMAQPVSEALTPESAKMVAEAMAIWVPKFLDDPSAPLSQITEVDQPHKNGSIINTEVTTTYILNEQGKLEIVGVSRDISSRKQAEAIVRESEARYRTFFEQNPDGVVVLNPENGRILDFNDQACRQLGYTREEFFKLSVADIEVVESPEEVQQHIKKIVEEGHDNFITKHHTKQGEIRDVQVIAQVIKLDERTIYHCIWRDITEGKQAEEALRKSEQQFKTLVETAPNGIVMVNADGQVVFANPTAEKILGLTRTKMAKIEYNSPEWKITALDGGPFADEQLPFVRVMQTGKSVFDVQHAIEYPNGIRVLLSINAAPIHDDNGNPVGMIASIDDITSRKQAEEALLKSENLYRKMNENSPLGLHFYELTVDNHLIFTGANPAADKLLGVDNAEFVGKTIEDAFPPLIQTEIPERYRDAASTGIPWSTEQIVYEDEHIAGAFEVRAFQTTPGNMVAVFSDITARKQAEEEVRRLNAELEQRVRERTLQLETANKELEAFSYSVSHDLRAPLRGIDGWSQALFEDYGHKLDEEGQKYIQRVRFETQRMGRLIDDMLHLSRVTRAEMNKEQVDLSALAHAVIERLRRDASQREVEFIVQKNLTAQGDPRLLGFVFENLLENAFKFSSKVTKARIEFGNIDEKDGRQVFFVRDNGAGFDMAHAQKLFGAFQRMHKVSEFPGTGIGLAIVQRVIHRHGGNVWADAKTNEGATFYFTLPE